MLVFGAVDIGANSVRLKISRCVGGALRVVHEDREVTRLGAAVFATHELAPEAMAQTIQVLSRFRRACLRYAADRVRVVGTSPLREARNTQEFVAWARAATGWVVEVLSARQEAELIHAGVAGHLRAAAGRDLLMDLGGGSCELTVARGASLEVVRSLSLGAVRLTEAFLHHDPPRAGELDRMREHIRRQIRPTAALVRRLRPQRVFATSGTAAALAAVTGHKHAGTVPAKAVRRVAAELASETAAQRNRRRGVGTRRAEIVVAGSAVFAELLAACALPGFRFLPLGLRDGLLAAMAGESRRRARGGGQAVGRRETPWTAAARRFAADELHAQRVEVLAGKLFGALRGVHELPLGYREVLAAGAWLHEIGGFVNPNAAVRHSAYLASAVELAGMSPQVQIRVSRMLALMEGPLPSPTDPFWKRLSWEERLHLPRAAAVLRLACACDRGRQGAVRGVRAQVGPRRLRLVLMSGPRGAAVELAEAARERPYVRTVFDRDLAVEGG